MRKFATLFAQFDVDNLGVLTVEEIENGFDSISQQLRVAASEESFDMLEAGLSASSFDVSRSGKISYVEFTAALALSLKELFDEMLIAEFLSLDVEGKGHLNRDNLAFLTEIVSPLMGDVSRARFKGELDGIYDDSGKLDFISFCTSFGRRGINYEKLRPTTKLGLAEKTLILVKEGASAKTKAKAKPKASRAVSKDRAASRSRIKALISSNSAPDSGSESASSPGRSKKIGNGSTQPKAGYRAEDAPRLPEDAAAEVALVPGSQGTSVLLVQEAPDVPETPRTEGLMAKQGASTRLSGVQRPTYKRQESI